MKNEKELLESIKQMRLGTSQLDREREYWTLEEREQLIRMYTSLVGITEIAIQLQRRESAIIQQIVKLGLFDLAENIPHRQRSEKKPVCLCCKCLIHDGCPFYQSMQHITEDD